jgi:zinc protease
MAGSRQHPEKLDWAHTIVPEYSGLTHKDMSRLANTYLDLEKAARIRILPAQ